MDITGFMPQPDAVGRIEEKLTAYNESRNAAQAEVRRRMLLLLAAVATLLVAGMVLLSYALPDAGFFTTPYLVLFMVVGVLAFLARDIVQAPATKLQQTLRDTVFPEAFSFVESLRYQHRVAPMSIGRVPAAATGLYTGEHFDDVISGSHGGFPFELYETVLTRKAGKTRTTVFSGVILAFQCEASFPGTLVAVKSSSGLVRLIRNLLGGLSRVESGVADLDRIYEFHSDNPDAARPLIGGSLAQALDWLRETWPEELARVALRNDDGFVLLPMGKNFFELPDIAVELDYRAHVEPIIAELVTLLATAALVRRALAH